MCVMRHWKPINLYLSLDKQIVYTNSCIAQIRYYYAKILVTLKVQKKNPILSKKKTYKIKWSFQLIAVQLLIYFFQITHP